jgi:hypothetical protein
MTENSNPEKRLNDLERRHKTREFLIDALSVAMALLAVFHYKPEGRVAWIIAFVGAFVANLLGRLLWPMCEILLVVLSFTIYLYTLGLATYTTITSFPALLLTMFLPVIAQVYWIWAVWAATGTLFHPLTLLCVAWLTLLGITIFERNIFANPASATIKLRHYRD